MNGARTAVGILGLGLLLSACQPTRPSAEISESAAEPSLDASRLSPSPSKPADATPSTPAVDPPIPTVTAPPPAAVSSSPADASEAPPSDAASSASPEATTADPTATLETAIPIASTYRQPDGLFEISFPPGYSFRELDNGVSFISRDRQFGGSANVLSAEGQTLTNELLEIGLKEEYANRLQAVEWQASTVQADGSLRVDWLGVDTNGDVLDSVSFVEQHGDRIYILNLHAINEAYTNHETDATIIVENYRLLWDE